jgi:2-polyprenyl-3-methyl-5-hydroxy-6-metoxy-1,4-benzoquinol methylase
MAAPADETSDTSKEYCASYGLRSSLDEAGRARDVVERIVGHYTGRWRQGYVRGKLKTDPAYGAVLDLLGESAFPVLDVGCGLGLLEFYLRERGFVPSMTGIDFDARKIAAAQQVGEKSYRSLRFSVGDVMCTDAFVGNVVMLDVLHYLPKSRHAPLLEHLADLVAPGGICVIRATPRDGSWRFRITRMQEVFLYAIRWMKSGAVHYPKVEEVVAPFEQRGFRCEVRPLWGRTPFNSHLFVFRSPY